MDKAKRLGMEAYAAELNEKITLLKKQLESYDDGRRKGFYCLAVNLLELMDVKTVTEQIDDAVDDSMSIKEKSKTAVRLFEAMAEHRGVVLKLRK